MNRDNTKINNQIKNINQNWNLKLFTGLGERNLIDLGSLLAIKIIEIESTNGKNFIVVAVMNDGVEISLTKWFDSETKALAKLSEFQDIITKRLKFFFYGPFYRLNENKDIFRPNNNKGIYEDGNV